MEGEEKPGPRPKILPAAPVPTVTLAAAMPERGKFWLEFASGSTSFANLLPGISLGEGKELARGSPQFWPLLVVGGAGLVVALLAKRPGRRKGPTETEDAPSSHPGA